MPAISFVVIVLFIGILWVSRLVNHIPDTGRNPDAKGEKITAIITNSNKYAERSATLHAEKDGRKFKVKLKPTEARQWIKGDEIEILLSEDKSAYRVLFSDYFRKNESRIREYALGNLKKTNKHIIAGRLTGYTEKHYEFFEKSSFDSLQIFSFVSYMRLVDIYSAVAALTIAATLIWWQTASPAGGTLAAAGLLIVLMIWSLYNAVQSCKRMIKKVEPIKDEKEQD